jgi:hypothetical protein
MSISVCDGEFFISKNMLEKYIYIIFCIEKKSTNGEPHVT